MQPGRTLPIKFQLFDSDDTNISSPSTVVHAASLTLVSSSTSGSVEDSGNANPDNDFRYDQTLGGTGGYIFNLSTKGPDTGTYKLNFNAGDDTLLYSVSFQVK